MSFRNRIEEEMRENHPYFDRPLFIIARDSKLRRYCHRFVHAKWGDDADLGGGGGNGSRAHQNAGASKRHKQIQLILFVSLTIEIFHNRLQWIDRPDALLGLGHGADHPNLMRFNASRKSMANNGRKPGDVQLLSSGNLSNETRER